MELCYKTPHRSVRGPAAVFRCLKRICAYEVSQLFAGETFLALQYVGLFVPAVYVEGVVLVLIGWDFGRRSGLKVQHLKPQPKDKLTWKCLDTQESEGNDEHAAFRGWLDFLAPLPLFGADYFSAFVPLLGWMGRKKWDINQPTWKT